MRKLLAIVHKEYILLMRDISGLFVLFFMPMFLIIVVTLAQEDTLSSIQESKISMLYVDMDRGALSGNIEQGLKESEYFEVKKEIDGEALTEEQIKERISRGDFQIGIVIPRGATAAAKWRAGELVKKSMTDKAAMEKYINSPQGMTGVAVYFDPAIRDSYRNAVTSSMQRLVQAVEMRIMLDVFFDMLRAEMKKQIQAMSDKYKRKDIAFDVPELNFPWKPGSLVGIKEIIARHKQFETIPSMIQNNVPGFALFAMFFIVIPLSWSLIQEKGGGTSSRLRTLPVSYLTIMAGKVIVYLGVCMIQLALMVAAGMFILPLLGTPALVMGTQYGAILAAAVASALAAIGFGMLVGSVAGTIPQASMFGSVMVVIMAVLGGIMIPVYLMPHSLDVAGGMISPIRWGIDAFLELFVRGGNFMTIIPNIVKLTVFFLVCISLSVFASYRRT